MHELGDILLALFTVFGLAYTVFAVVGAVFGLVGFWLEERRARRRGRHGGV